MDKTIETECGIFTYRIENDLYVVITGFRHKDGEISFLSIQKDPDGNRRFLLTIPETIENLPVLGVCGLSLNLDSQSRYPDNMFTVRKPEGCSFFGFSQIKRAGGYYWPKYEIEDYRRNDSSIFVIKKKGISFIARPTADGGCSIIRMSGELYYGYTNQYVLNPTVSPKEMIIPSVINGKPVKSICDHTECLLPGSIEIIRIPDTIETIGCQAFQNLKNLKTVRLGRHVRSIGENAFSYHKEEREEYIKPIPILTVYYYHPFESPSSAFSRTIEALIGDDYKDWGWMKTGSRMIEYQPMFVHINSSKKKR